MVDLRQKRWYFFVWDEHNIDHLDRHDISPEEAEEVFFNKYLITANKGKHKPPRYMIAGHSNQNRYLRIIFEDLGKQMARVITGWDL